MAFLKPQSPLAKGNDYFYPLTTADQVIMDGGYRLDQIVGKVEKSTITLYQNGWSTAAPYSYSIMVKGLADDLNMKVLPHYPENFEEKQVLKEEFAKVSFCSRQGNIVTFECWDEIPNMDISIDIEVNVLYPIEMTLNEEVESRLPELNYSIVGSVSQPNNPTKNMIWVNTDQKITNYIFSKNEPKNPIEGTVWILLGESSSVAFYSFNVNGIGFDEIYPISAKQYISGVWVDKTAKTYQGGEWAGWTTFIYKYGNEFTDLTGGWKATAISNTPTITKDSSSMDMSIGGVSWQGGYGHTLNKINTTGKTKLICKFGNAYSQYIVWFGLIANLTQNIDITSMPAYVDLSGKTGSVTVDISTIQGQYFIGFGIATGESSSTAATINDITEIFME